MELYILSRQDLGILSISKVSEYKINLDEETNAKSMFTLINTQGLGKDNFIVLNGLYRQFLFIIDEVHTEKGSNVSTVTALDISNLFDRKVIEKNIDTMTTNSIEKFIADTMAENFVNSDDTFLNVGYIDIYWHTNTQGVVATNAENGLYNFHTFLINCRQYKNIYTDFQFVNGRLKIDISYKEEATQLIDTTLPEVTNYNKIHEDDITAKVTVLIREDNSEYNLYLKTDHTTTTNKNDPDRASGKIEVISVDTADMASTEALNVMKGNTYKHLVEFKIAKTSKTMDITQLYIGRTIRIKTKDDIYDSYISAITLTDENFVYFKSGSLRDTLLDKLKQNNESIGDKLDKTGGVIKGTLNIVGDLKAKGNSLFSNPIGEFILWEGNTSGTENGSFHWLACYYNAKINVLQKFPLKTGFTRKYKLVIDYTTTNILSETGHFFVQFKVANGGAVLKEYAFRNIWGLTTDGVRTQDIKDFDIADLGTEHIDISVTPQYGSGAAYRVYRIYLLVYDEMEV